MTQTSRSEPAVPAGRTPWQGLPVQHAAAVRRNRGFTLLEIMVVLSILGMAAMLVVPNLGGLDSRSFNAEVRETTATLNYARRMAVVRGLPAKAEFTISNTLSYRDATNRQHDEETIVEITFFPEGGSTGGELLLRQGNRAATIRIDPFSGRVSTEFSQT